MSLLSYKKVGLFFDIEETISSGIELFGFEVKALRTGKGSLEGGKVLIRGGEAFVVGIFIPPFQEKNAPKNYDPFRIRKLLLHKSEIHTIAHHEEMKHLTAIPLSLYIKGSYIKCDIALVKKKQKGDKRENIKKDIARREIRQVK